MNQSILLHNKAFFKIKTSDGHLLNVFSVFYAHPAMINEDGWTLMKDMKVLVDVDTMFLLESNISEFGWDKDKLLTCKITSKLEGDALKKHWDKLYKHSLRTKKRMSQHFDKDKLCDLLDDMKINKETDTNKSDVSQDSKDLA